MLALGELVEAAGLASRRRDDGAVRLEQARRHAGVEPRSTAGDRADRGDQVGGGRVLQDEAAGAGLERRPQQVVLVERRQDDHGGRRRELPDRPGGGNAVEPRHPDVHHDHVHLDRVRARQADDGVGAIRVLGHDVEPVLGGEDAGDARADDRLVVDEGDADHDAASTFRVAPSRSGTAARTSHPDAVGPTSIVPPTAAIRSLMPTMP